MSFGFTAVREQFEEKDRPTPLRSLKEVELFDVSPVTFPAYAGTDGAIALRAAAELGALVAVSLGSPAAVASALGPGDPELSLRVRLSIRALLAVLEGGDCGFADTRLAAAIASLRALDHPADATDDSLSLNEVKRILDENRRRTQD